MVIKMALMEKQKDDYKYFMYLEHDIKNFLKII